MISSKQIGLSTCLAAATISLLIGFLAGCSSSTTPFVAGHVVSPPAGCVEARSRGHEC